MKYLNCALSAIFLLFSSWLPQVADAQTIAQNIAQSPAQSPTVDDKPLSQVAIMTVSKDVTFIREVLGIVFAPQMQTISAQVTGVVTSDRLGMGTRVEKGDVIVSLDSREADAKLALAVSEMMGARINLEKQRLEFSRVEQTFAKKLISKADFDNAKLALRKASNELSGFEAKVDVAKIFVEKHRIVAPFRGVLMANTPVVGLQLSPGQEVVNIVNTDELRLKTLLTYDELTKISTGQAQLLTPNQGTFRLLHSAPNASDANGMFEAEFAILNRSNPALNAPDLKPADNATKLQIAMDGDFYSGLALKLTLFENKIHLPEQAIVQSADRNFVMAVSNNKVIKVAINELVVGQQVVVQGPSDLVPGDNVAVLALEE